MEKLFSSSSSFPLVVEDSCLLWLQDWECNSTTTTTNLLPEDYPSGCTAAAASESDVSCLEVEKTFPSTDAVRSTFHEWQKEDCYSVVDSNSRVDKHEKNDVIRNTGTSNITVPTGTPKMERDASKLVDLRWIHHLSSEELLQRLQKRCRPDDIPAVPMKRKRLLTCSFLQKGRMEREPFKQQQLQCADVPIECHDYVPPSPSVWTWNESTTNTTATIPWEDLLLPLWNHETTTIITTQNGEEESSDDTLLLEWISAPPLTADGNTTEDDPSPFHHPKEGAVRSGGNGKAKFVGEE
jgi:hypothetical protein